jgi:hypothetical protein
MEDGSPGSVPKVGGELRNDTPLARVFHTSVLPARGTRLCMEGGAVGCVEQCVHLRNFPPTAPQATVAVQTEPEPPAAGGEREERPAAPKPKRHVTAWWALAVLALSLWWGGTTPQARERGAPCRGAQPVGAACLSGRAALRPPAAGTLSCLAAPGRPAPTAQLEPGPASRKPRAAVLPICGAAGRPAPRTAPR